ncbi:hypothetical protein [Teichococcus oryzae]|uniref:YncE family protein n=1 Tax=Teichococcus oryzae TaxID=1608942 RepID=A0A5B2TFW4_9PROT|nr:hypothetical protein [Pseudoroseomonas oryzae]KAA2213386.1 hypothetical protein F0Q34_09065 [Pseudoroseomonas oryzae]
MRALSFIAVALTVLAGPGSVQAETVYVNRAVITDHARGGVTLVDLLTGRILRRLDTASPGSLRRGAAPGQVSLAQGPAGRVDVIDLGITVENHGDHADLRLSGPRLIPGVAHGPKPSHVLAGDGRLASFFDGDGSVVVTGEGAPVTLRANAAHHGLAYPFHAAAGPMLLVSHAAAAGARPGGVVLLDAGGRETARRDDCPMLHGEAVSNRVIALGCADGVLLLDTRSQVFRKVAYPEGTASGRMVRSLAGGADFHLFAADFGPDAVTILDPDAGRFMVVELPARRVAYALDPERSASMFVITEDGGLHRIDTLKGEILASVPLLRRYSMDGGWALARPRLSAAGGMVAVTDPAQSRLLVLDAGSLALRHEIAIEGTPFNILAIAASGERH